MLLDRCYWTDPTGQILLDRCYWTDPTGQILLDRCYWTDPTGQILLDRSYWTDATGQILLDRCYWTDPTGQILLDRSYWTDPTGQILLDRSYWTDYYRYLVEGCGMDQGTPHYILVWIPIRGLTLFLHCVIAFFKTLISKNRTTRLRDWYSSVCEIWCRSILKSRSNQFKCSFIRGLSGLGGHDRYSLFLKWRNRK